MGEQACVADSFQGSVENQVLCLHVQKPGIGSVGFDVGRIRTSCLELEFFHGPLKFAVEGDEEGDFLDDGGQVGGSLGIFNDDFFGEVFEEHHGVVEFEVFDESV